MLQKPEFSDIKILVGDETINAHRAVLSAQSDVFQAMFESGLIESKSNSVRILDFDKETVKELIDYLYGRELQSTEIER